jgi:predicted ester cyclase
MIDIKNKRCIFDNCNKGPVFNLPTETKALYCSEHKLPNMIDIKNKRCIFDNCNKGPVFNLPTETKALYCSEHKLPNMIDIKSKRCIFDNCNTRPVFNLPTETKALYCSEHKLPNMIDIKNKRCIFDNCNKGPTFNLPTETKALYCSEHKLPNMIDIKSKNCQHKSCKKDALFGIINKRPQYCSDHKLTNMINVVLENKCSIIGCDNEFTELFDGDKFCNRHIPEGKLNVVKRLCKYCDILENATHICNNCKKIMHKKEYSIVRHLKKVVKYGFIHDSSKMLNGCSKKRPDIYYDLPMHCVIVEIDENQHNTYENSCECARLNEIVNGIGGKSVIVIRYNPDTVRNKGKQLNINQIDRVNLLVDTINQELSAVYEQFTIKLIQIYYNDSYDIYQPIKTEDITKLIAI